jgi:sec-independent protein translocase protein TatA
MFGLGPAQLIIVGVVAVLLFGERLPAVARALGKSLTEFKRGMQGLDTEFRDALNSEPSERVTYEEHRAPSAPAFEPPLATAAEKPEEPAATS